MRWLEIAILSVLVAVAGGGLLWRGRRVGDYPPIIVVVIDTLRADHLGCYGYFRDTSPRLDALAGESLRFERAMTPIGTTLPAITSLFSSMNPLEHGIVGNTGFNHRTITAEGDVHLMAQLLRDLGYRTGAIVTSPAVADFTGLPAGFEYYNGGKLAKGDPPAIAEYTTKRALAWLDTIDTAQPFFLFVHYVDPHSPYKAPPPYAGTYTADDALRDFLQRHGVRVDARYLEANNGYDEEVRYVDEHVGRLLDELRRRGIYDRAALVVTADHGEGLGQHGWSFHSRIYTEQMMIPMFMRLPGRDELHGQRYADPVSLVDVLPTLVTELRLPIASAQKAQFVGFDVLGADHRAYVYAERPRPQQRGDPDKGQYYALAGTRWKFIHDPVNNRDRLFDLEQDPAELHDVVQREPALAGSLHAALLDLIKLYGEHRDRLIVEAKQDLPESAREELRQLGYDF